MNEFEIEIYKSRNTKEKNIINVKRNENEEEVYNYVSYIYKDKVLCVQIILEKGKRTYEEKEEIINTEIKKMNELLDRAFVKNKKQRPSTAALIDLTSKNIRNLNATDIINQIQNEEISEIVKSVYTSVVRGGNNPEEVYNNAMMKLGIDKLIQP